MAKKKDFTDNIDSTASVYNALDIATGAAQDAQEKQEIQGNKKKYKDRKTYTEQEIKEAQEQLKTSGRKGAALPRINLAFKPSNYEFVKTAATIYGMNLTEFINYVIEEYADNHKDITEQYNRVLELRKSLKK